MTTTQRQQEGRDEEGELPPSSWTAHGAGSREAGVCAARRERSASAARAQRELSAPGPAHEGASTQKPAARTAELGAAAAAAAARGTSTHPRTKPVAPALARRLRQVHVEATRKPAPPALVPACAAACRPSESQQTQTCSKNRTETAGRDDFRSSERHHHFSLCVFSLALLLPRAAVPGAGARPPRRAALALLPLVPRTRTTPPPFEI